MKNKIQKFSKGDFQLIRPDVIFDETNLVLIIGEGEVYRGSFTMRANNEGRIRGLVYSSSFRVHFKDQGFEGNPSRVEFTYDGRGLRPGHVEEGKFTIVCSGGEYELSFTAIIEKPYVMTTYGKVQSTDDFRKLAIKDFSEAEAGYDVLKSMKQENVCYAEIRFAPLLSETPDMNCNKVIEALLAGLEKGKRDFGIEYGVITCAMRHHSEEENARMLRTAREYLGHGVCAADLAGAESLYPMSEFMELFKKTKALGMPFTLHAGECGSVQNILDSVETGAGRIGHGIAMRGYADVQKELQKKGIGIEMCPISNLQTKAVESTKNYPMREFLNAGLKVTVNTDNRTVSNTTLTKELEFIQKNYRITDEEIHLMMRNAVDVAFADDAVKERMLKYV